ncbi:MAG: RNA-guided pseudouridylation complex pseudouridine synthase subunit Cbf5 [Nitrososphaerota archaeon]|nr:RNA-guided pseudouridylation complex pseudouridine synthase subunit Cbf5 [Nitrososphaerota archaeon]MDG6928394.1 RNA-guided pseudouridylation complex pseudouridine synthase subunit Cbf5 [Nitrososphaerota archaeon]MDG6929677.1 RNA-guided pseudouridylation complex pseudouridine synthase subunit Cbf5 [Nitrososphaerota archaeon]MDG6933052.1 RNA-guided pseudouridylation complex pseudouridine synthase subunit Cbf5 [Nitrososphaerota archaeon]MDG6936246.1 RNA-guided pseudouridylation complex pseudou
MQKILDALLTRTVPLFEEPTDPSYGHAPEERTVAEVLEYGFVPLDKPSGMNSFEAVDLVKRLLNVSKAGHSGTLDPPVSGLLPIALGSATKALSSLLLGPKEYYAVMKIHKEISKEEAKAAIEKFQGLIYQRPPIRSSVKREVRARRIFELELVETDGKFYLLRILCESGTYVRKLIYDMGELLGVGASMVDLRRTKVSGYGENDGFVRLQEVYMASEALKRDDTKTLKSVVFPIESAMRHLKPVIVKDSAVASLCNGAYLAIPGIARIDPSIQQNDNIAIYTLKGEIIATGRAVMDFNSIEESQKGIAAMIERVIMKENTYPRSWKAAKQAL